MSNPSPIEAQEESMFRTLLVLEKPAAGQNGVCISSFNHFAWFAGFAQFAYFAGFPAIIIRLRLQRPPSTVSQARSWG